MSKAPAPATATASAEPLVANAPQATRSEIERKLAALYRERPTISSYVVQDVTYTQESLGAVLQKCTTAGSAVTAQTQSSVLLACAPPIFFLYSFAKQHSVPAALDLADMIYSYAITNIEGPESSPTILAGTLRDWGVDVGYTKSPPPSAHTSPAVASLVAEVRKAILTRHSVRVTITGSHGGQVVETITSDIGTTSASELLSDNGAVATIRVTPRSVYFMGNTAGLTNLIGLTKASARRIGKDWVQVTGGSVEYRDFAAEDTLPALPASVLPDASQSVSLGSSTLSGRRAPY